MATSTLGPLPEYDRPPVIEVVCGLQFAPLKKFQATAFGLLWQRFRPEYPTCEEHPPLTPFIEPDEEAVAEERRVELTTAPPLPRMFFVHQTPCWLIQVQRDRFLHNWRKHGETDVYPRFPAVYKAFWSAWEQFLGFCRDEDTGAPKINQLELTYINHIVEGDGWNGTATIGHIFPDLSWRAQRSFLPPPEAAAWRTSFILPGGCGRLHVSVRQAIRRSDMKPVLLCELTARGVPNSLDEDAIRKWFHLGREWIVRGFADLTDNTVQNEVWKRKKA